MKAVSLFPSGTLGIREYMCESRLELLLYIISSVCMCVCVVYGSMCTVEEEDIFLSF